MLSIHENEKTLADQSMGLSAHLQQLQGYKEHEKHKHKLVMADSFKANDHGAQIDSSLHLVCIIFHENTAMVVSLNVSALLCEQSATVHLVLCLSKGRN